MWRKLIARYLLLARAILPLLRHTRGAARGRRKSPRRLLGLGSAAFSPFYCDKNPDGERPAFWKTGFTGAKLIPGFRRPAPGFDGRTDGGIGFLGFWVKNKKHRI